MQNWLNIVEGMDIVAYAAPDKNLDLMMYLPPILDFLSYPISKVHMYQGQEWSYLPYQQN